MHRPVVRGILNYIRLLPQAYLKIDISKSTKKKPSSNNSPNTNPSTFEIVNQFQNLNEK
jgi:hypothetical protein